MTPAQAMLKLDFDDMRPPLRRLVRLLDRAGYRLVAYAERRSPGGQGWHGWAVLDPVPTTLVEVVALQAICGSDPWREAATFYRARRAWDAFSRECANVLYVPARVRSMGRMPR